MDQPTYDWNWFKSKRPFLKLMQKHCNILINKETKYKYEYEIFKVPMNQYYISFDMDMLRNNFATLKKDMLSTNICKKNSDIKAIVKEISIDNIKDFTYYIILEGCISNVNGSLEWDIKNK